MRHGIAFRKLSRDSSHRDLMLRNMVSSLLQHEQIKTTVAKAKEASRVAEWIITMGKKGTLAEKRRAEAFLMNPEKTVPKLFLELSHRYASRAGGYTRIHRFGHRKGDHAPQAILELVDNPNDLKFGMTAKAVGRELAKLASGRGSQQHPEVARWAAATSSSSITPDTVPSRESLPSVYNLLRPRTRESLLKAIRHRQIPESPSSSSSSTTTSSAPSTFSLFEQMARDAFYRTSALSKVPSWQIDEGRASAIGEAAPKKQGGSQVVTLPGYGRKVWAGQEDLAQIRREEEEEAAWEDVDKEVHAEAQRELTRELRQERLAQLQKKMRHPDGRNGVNRQRSALSRAQGHRAAPRTLGERRQRLDMPAV